jgi:hypothetical protein
MLPFRRVRCPSVRSAACRIVPLLSALFSKRNEALDNVGACSSSHQDPSALLDDSYRLPFPCGAARRQLPQMDNVP